MACCGKSDTAPRLVKSLFNQSTHPDHFIKRYRYVILLVTFLAYMCYHICRKPLSVVKSTLRPSCVNNTNCSGWAPFDGPNGEGYLGALDSAFLFSYAAGMFISGHTAERMDLRKFLVGGMLLSAVTTALFGLGKYLNIHQMWYYGAVQAVSGLVQSTGWPAVVTCVSNWFGKGQRGFIMGIWNSHTSVGNILGSLVAGTLVESDWGLSFVVPGCIMAVIAILVMVFLVPCPKVLTGLILLQNDESDEESVNLMDNEEVQVLREDETVANYTHDNNNINNSNTGGQDLGQDEAISFVHALAIPGVVEFSLCLFFSKLVSYTFLFWLPYYISNSTSYNCSTSAELSTLFDVGGILGGVIAGLLSDLQGNRALVCSVMFLLAAPFMYLYYYFAGISLAVNICLLMATGFLVNGPYALITTAVSADLGTHASLRGNCKALSTVTSIIDGTGSIGAALGPLLTAIITPYGWNRVFQMLVAADLLALILLGRLTFRELRSIGDPHRDD